MSEPTPLVPHDPYSAILVMLTEIRGDVKSLVSSVDRHDTEIKEQRTAVSDLQVRMTAVETQLTADEKSTDGHTSNRVAFWSMIAALAACATVIVYVVLATRG